MIWSNGDMMHALSKPRLLAIAGAIAVVASACGGGADEGSSSVDAPTGAVPADAAPAAGTAPLEFTATQLSGESFNGSELEGTDTVLWFWAPWCTSCRAEAPDVVEAAGEFEESVEVVGVPGRGGTDEMAGFVSDTGTESLRHIVDSDGAIWRDFGIIGQPAFAFVNDDGTAEVFVGGLGKEQLVERMNALAAA
ncbi:MAG: redoxin domain-containing protein [Microthrixaceae bacterium]